MKNLNVNSQGINRLKSKSTKILVSNKNKISNEDDNFDKSNKILEQLKSSNEVQRN